MIPAVRSDFVAQIVLLVSMWWPVPGLAGILDRTASWEEEVALSDGSILRVSRSITRGADEWFRPGRGGTVKSTLAASVPRVGKIEFNWSGYELPVAFDIVAGTPWIVLPIAGIHSCEKYGNPAESVAAFSWRNGQWSWQPFEKAPSTLKQNILRSSPFNKEPLVTIALKRSYLRNDGIELRKGFIPEHVKWHHACHRINPPPDPNYQRSINEYMDMPRIALTASVVETKDDVISLTREDNQAMMGLGSEDQRKLIGCKGRVAGVHSIFSTRSYGGGSGSRGTLTAWRIALASDEGAARSIFLPARIPTPGNEAGRFLDIARIVCSEALIYVVSREESDLVSVVTYDFAGNWRDAWRIQIADFKMPRDRWGTVFDFRDDGDRFTLSIGEYRHNSGQSGLPVATLGKRYAIVASKARQKSASGRHPTLPGRLRRDYYT